MPEEGFGTAVEGLGGAVSFNDSEILRIAVALRSVGGTAESGFRFEVERHRTLATVQAGGLEGTMKVLPSVDREVALSVARSLPLSDRDREAIGRFLDAEREAEDREIVTLAAIMRKHFGAEAELDLPEGECREKDCAFVSVLVETEPDIDAQVNTTFDLLERVQAEAREAGLRWAMSNVRFSS